jgi:hypothetical protein
MNACPSAADATPLVEAKEPHVGIVTGNGTPAADGTCCYNIYHDLCY